jgi:thiol-disulfide isomerase/thioredoxin
MATLLAGRKLLTKWGAAPPEALHGKVVLLYFSASWCGPCHQFTPILKDFYESVVEEGGNLEIVYVPGDKSVPEMMEYFKMHADYLALDMSDNAMIQHLNQRYSIRGIPSCVVIQPDGEVIDADARSTVQRSGPRAFRAWKTAWKGGTTVTIQGLVGAAQHNGKTGPLLGFDAAKGRFTVALGGGTQVAVKPANVVLAALGAGAAVVVHGLQGAAQHNGKRGVVVGGPDPQSGRYAVQLQGTGADDSALGVKIANLQLPESAAVSAAGGGAAAAAAAAAAAGGESRGGLPNVKLTNSSGRPL